jgi:hypothetical protein
MLDSGAYFSVLPFSSGCQSNDKSYRLGQIWPAPRALTYLACGLLLGRPPLLLFFPHSSWNSSDCAGMGFTIATKSSNSSPPSSSYFCHSLLQEQIDSTVWTDEMSVRWARMALPIQIKLKNPLQFPHSKPYPLKPEGHEALCLS